MKKIQWKAALRCVSDLLHCVNRAVCVLAHIPLVEFIVVVFKAKQKKCKWFRQKIRRSMFRKWEDRLAIQLDSRSNTQLMDVSNPRPAEFSSYWGVRGHGCFNRYLYRTDKEENPAYLYCNGVQMWGVSAWARRDVPRLMDHIRELMLLIMIWREEDCNQVSVFKCTIMKSKMEMEWTRQQMPSVTP